MDKCSNKYSEIVIVYLRWITDPVTVKFFHFALHFLRVSIFLSLVELKGFPSCEVVF